MNDFIDYLQHRVDETKQKVQEITDRVNQALTERETLVADLAGYERTLAAERRGQGVITMPQPMQQIPPNSSNGSAPEINKSDFARQFIRSRAEIGVTPADLYKGFQDAGIPIGKPYIYALVQRLQKQTAIQQRRGKWYSVPEPQP